MAPRNLNAPANWLAWLRACSRSPSSPIRLGSSPRPFAALTGQDMRALGAIAACWHLYASSDDDGMRGATDAIVALLPAVQESCWHFARELVAQSLDWHNREPLYEPLRLRALEAGDRGLEARNRRALDSLGAFTGALRANLHVVAGAAERSRAVREDLQLGHPVQLLARGHYYCPECEKGLPLLAPCEHVAISPEGLATLKARL